MVEVSGRTTAAFVLCHGLVLAGVIAGDAMVLAQPIPLPYRSREPFIPVIDLFGGSHRGLVLGAEEADSGRPAPISIGNTTFYPQVRRAGTLYGGYTSVRGDLQILEGDLYIQEQAIGDSIRQHNVQIQTLETNATQTQQSLNQTQQTLTQTQQSIQLNSQAIEQQQQSIHQLSQSVDSLGQATSQQAEAMAEQGQAINGMAADLNRAQQDIRRQEQNITNLGSGVAGATALVAALGSLPDTSGSAPMACGVGTGGYSDRYALAMGCSVSLSAALSINAGGAYVFGGSRSYGAGSLGNIAGNVGLAYRFGAAQGGERSRRQTHTAIEKELQSMKATNRELRELVAGLSKRLEALEPAAQAARMR